MNVEDQNDFITLDKHSSYDGISKGVPNSVIRTKGCQYTNILMLTILIQYKDKDLLLFEHPRLPAEQLGYDLVMMLAIHSYTSHYFCTYS